jgi:hypothetical protein
MAARLSGETWPSARCTASSAGNNQVRSRGKRENTGAVAIVGAVMVGRQRS